jgi:hypothetical protein
MTRVIDEDPVVAGRDEAAPRAKSSELGIRASSRLAY